MEITNEDVEYLSRVHDGVDKEHEERLKQFFDEDIQKHDLKPSEAVVWICLHNEARFNYGHVCMTVTEISEKTNIGQKTVRLALDTLNKKKLIRQPKCKTSKRLVPFYIILAQDGTMTPDQIRFMERNNKS